MINPFHYEPCRTPEEYRALPARLVLNEYVFIKRAFNPEKQHTEYVWEDVLKNTYGPLL